MCTADLLWYECVKKLIPTQMRRREIYQLLSFMYGSWVANKQIAAPFEKCNRRVLVRSSARQWKKLQRHPVQTGSCLLNLYVNEAMREKIINEMKRVTLSTLTQYFEFCVCKIVCHYRNTVSIKHWETNKWLKNSQSCVIASNTLSSIIIQR